MARMGVFVLVEMIVALVIIRSKDPNEVVLILNFVLFSAVLAVILVKQAIYSIKLMILKDKHKKR